MKIRSWRTECLLKRQNKGKPTAAQLANEQACTQLRANISALQAHWATEDAAKQSTRKNESTEMNTDTKAKIRQLVHDELKKRFWDYSRYADALAHVLATHKEFSNTAAIKIEMMNELHSKPTPLQFQSEVRREMTAAKTDYDTAFATVLERHSEMHHRPELANVDLGDSTAAGRELQEVVDKYFAEHPALDRRLQSVYQMVFNRVCELHPAIVSRMHQPGRSAVNLWHQQSSDGHTPASTNRASGRELSTPANRAAKA